MSYGERVPFAPTPPKPKTEEQKKKERFLNFINSHSRLPKAIIVDKQIYELEVDYEHETVDSYFVGYCTSKNFPDKKVFMFYEETDKYLAVMKAWRKLAENGIKVTNT